MDDRKCYNCGDTSHISIRCPNKQKYSRCQICAKACFSERSHASWCTNLEFRSTYNGDQSLIHEIDEIVQIELKPISKMVVVSPTGEKIIDESTIWFANANIQLKSNDRKLVFSGTKTSDRRTFVFLDENGDRRLKLEVDDGQFMINGHYKVSKNGYISYNRFEEPNTYGRADCSLKFKSDNYVVHAKVTWRSSSYFLDIYPDGAILSDPYKLYLDKHLKLRIQKDQSNAENIDGAHFVEKDGVATNENLLTNEPLKDGVDEDEQSRNSLKEIEQMVLHSFGPNDVS